MPRFDAKVVLITGGGAGIGRHYAHRFAREGADIVIADLDTAAAESVVAEVVEIGTRATAITMDVTDSASVTAMAAAAADTFGGIDVLVNNAGMHLGHAQLPFTVEALDTWRKVMDVNVIGVLACSAACRSAMTGREGASIINHSSMAAYGGGGAYSVSKLALNALTVGLAKEFAKDGIRVNGIAPGLVDSEAAVEWLDDPAQRGVREGMVKAQLIRRLGKMDDIANLALFLASAEANFITGQTMLVDGGLMSKAH